MARTPHELPEERAEDELLLDAVLGEPAQRSEARARLAADARGTPRLRLLEQRLERTRSELRAGARWSDAREERLIARVLAATTRRPIEQRRTSARRRSLLPRLAAAVLIVCAGALVLRVSGARSTWGRSGELSFPRSDAPSTRAGAGTAPGSVAVLDSAPSAADVELVLARARARLATSATARSAVASRSAPASEEPLELRLLEARARGLREHRWEGWLKALPLTELRPLAQALWCEVQLDRYALTGELPPAWSRAVAILERGLRRASDQEGSAKLLEHALARAHTYGLAEGPALASALAPEELWTGEWFDELESAGRQAGLAEAGLWRAWVDWRGQ